MNDLQKKIAELREFDKPCPKNAECFVNRKKYRLAMQIITELERQCAALEETIVSQKQTHDQLIRRLEVAKDGLEYYQYLEPEGWKAKPALKTINGEDQDVGPK